MDCKICANKVEVFCHASLLRNHEVAYYRCTSCGFVCTEEPYWLEEAYSSAITGSDVGLVRRNIQLATTANVVISLFFGRSGRFIDYAGGYGLFVRLMRDSGFDFRWYDKYCENLLAHGFDAPEAGTEPVKLLTAFEVFEHLADPASELDRMLAFSRNVLFTTQLLPEPAPRPGEWWYYGLEHGQHIAFYTRKALAELATRHGLNFYTNGSSMHLFTEKQLVQPLFSGVARYKLARLMATLLTSRSLLAEDYHNTAGVRLG